MEEERIDPLRVSWIRKVVFSKYPVNNSGESEEKVWKICVAAIDGLKRQMELNLQNNKRFKFDEEMLFLGCSEREREKENAND